MDSLSADSRQNASEQVNDLLRTIETELRQLDLWHTAAPSAEALQSVEPFCIDTLDLSQWLQWILLPRMHALLDGQLPLPRNSNIRTIAEQNFNALAQDCSQLLLAIQALDQVLSDPSA